MLSQDSLAKIDIEIKKYPSEQVKSAIMAALRIAQEEQKWLSVELIEYVANYLHMPAVAAYEVATFYNMYRTKPVGENVLTVCTNLPCALGGGVNAADYIKTKLNIDFGQTTTDGKFTLLEGECMGACGDAPVMLVNHHKMCSFMSSESIDQLLTELGGK